MTDELLESKESFVKRLDGTFEKYESIVHMREDLEKIQKVLEKLQNSGLREQTIILLIHDHTRIGKKTIKQLLDGLQEIPYKYFRHEDEE